MMRKLIYFALIIISFGSCTKELAFEQDDLNISNINTKPDSNNVYSLYNNAVVKLQCYKRPPYKWSTGATTSSITVDKPGTYFVSYTGYSIYGEDEIQTDTFVCKHSEYNISFVSVFTPIGDGRNDLFTIESFGIKNMRTIIYNVENVKVFESNDVVLEWYGRDNDKKKLQKGVYYYFVRAKFLDNSIKEYKGEVRLI